VRRWLNRTPQTVDPIGGVVDAPVVVIGAAITTVTAFVLTAVHWRDVRVPVAAALGVLLVVAAAIALFAATMPSRAPFTPERLGLVVALAVGASVAEYVSTAGANRFLYDDYGAAVIGLLILALSPYCSWVSLAIAGLLSAAVSTILVIGAAPTTVTGAPVVSLVTVNAAIILSMTAAASVYSMSVVSEVLRWQREANRAMLRRDAEREAAPLRSSTSGDGGTLDARSPHAPAMDARATEVRTIPVPQPSRVSVLRSQVLPFLAQVTTADRISRAESDRARELVEALRQALRAGVEATWLDDLAESVRRGVGIPVDVADRDRDASRLDDQQRAAVTALLGWLAEGGRARSIHVDVSRVVGDPLARLNGGGEPLARLTVSALRSDGWTPKRRDLDRFIAISRVVGLRARTAATGENVRVEIDYALG
jgi:hypothetical protein